MLTKLATRSLMILCVFIAVGVTSLLAQGVSRHDYTGLDKYIGADRPDDFSFVGVRAAEFLTIPVGARGIGMGSAYTAVSDDITSIWWNPAGLGFLQNKEAMFNVVDYVLDITYSYAAFASPVGDGRVVLGGFFGYLDVPDIEITTLSNPGGTGSFYNAYDFQMGGSLAYNLSDRFVGGLNLKYVHQDVQNNIGGSAFAIDAGVVYYADLADREVRFSFAMQNLGTNITMRGSNLDRSVGPENLGGAFPTGYENYTGNPDAFSQRGNRQVQLNTHTYRLPTVIKMAIAYNLLTTEKVNWLVSGEFWRPSNIPIAYSTGSELNYSLTPFLSGALRIGWMIQQDEFTESTDRQTGAAYLGDDPTFRGLSFGGGVKRQFGGKTVAFSYAYRNKGRLTADNYFTVTFGF